MILVDQRVGSVELLPHIRKNGIPCESAALEFGDVALEGRGPDGTIMIGIERKRLHDMLSCVDDARYSAHQRPGMKKMYALSFLIVEGNWKPHSDDGTLMEGFNGGNNWGQCKYRSQRVMYSKLYRYLLSVSLSGVIVTYSRDIAHTAYNICELYHYWQKDFDKHTSLMETQKLNIPSLNGPPSLVRKWAADLTGVGVKMSMDAEMQFKTPIRLATADERDWLRIRGLGVKSAQQIVREIHTGHAKL